jgi:predicted nucleic acid-binding protein
VNTSPLVFLGNLGRLELLRYKGHEVYITRAVAEEIAEKPGAAAQAVQAVCATWMQVRDVTDETAVTLNNLERRQAVSTERAGTKSWI